MEIDITKPHPPIQKRLDDVMLVVKRFGPTIQRLRLGGFDPVSSYLTPEYLQQISDLCPNLVDFVPVEGHCGIFPRLKSYNGEGLSRETLEYLQKVDLRSIQLHTKSPDDWPALVNSSITTIQNLHVYGGVSLDPDLYDDDPEMDQLIDISPFFKNNPNIRKINLCYFPKQIDLISPYLKNLTHIFFFAQELPERTWRIMGRELTSLIRIDTLDCHRLEDNHMEAWGSEMPYGSPLRIVRHCYSSVSPKAIADFIAPKCPNIGEVLVDVLWDEEALVAWGNSGRHLRTITIAIPKKINPQAISEFVKNGGGKKLRRFAIEIQGFVRELVLTDQVIQDIVTYCPELREIDLPYTVGVTKEGWEHLRKLAPWQLVNIGSDECSHELQEELALFKSHFNETPRERDEKQRKKEEKKAAKRLEREKQQKESEAWGAAFVRSKKEEILAAGIPNRFQGMNNTVKNLLKAAEGSVPVGLLPDYVISGAHSEANLIKGEYYQKVAEDARKAREANLAAQLANCDDEEDDGMSLFSI